MPIALIADDVEENLYLLQSLLLGSGYQVLVAHDGQEALDLAARERPDLVISDILMPGMDGFTLCRRWRQDERFGDIPFVFYTATYTDPRDEEFALSLGADSFLVKPVEPQEFLDQIADVLERHASGRIRTDRPARADETGYLREYSQTLVRKLEAKLAELVEANRALLIKDAAIESAPTGIALTDVQGSVTYANPAMARLFGCEPGALVGSRLGTMLGEEAAQSIDQAMNAAGDWSGELEVVLAAGGRPAVLEAVVHTVRDSAGRALCRMLSLQDVSERRRMAEEMQQHQRLASLSLFAGGIAHDFNNLLTGLFGNIELAKSSLGDEADARQFLDTAARAYERARDLTTRLLAFAKSRPPERVRHAVIPVLRDCCALSLSGSTVRWTITGPEDLAVLADANQLSQVFTNIVLNARQAMPNGGTLAMSVEASELRGDARGLEDGRYVEVRFTDSGPGIPDDLLPRVFDPFFTTKPNGTGLGLAVCHSIVAAHGGAIRVRSTPGQGTTFALLLPAVLDADAAQKSAEAPDSAAHVSASLAGGRVLVMDDEQAVRDVAERMLKQAGFDVRVVSNGDEALEACREAAAGGRMFDAVLLDITVRGGMGGLEALSAIRAAHPGTPVVLSSGYAGKGWTDGDVHPDAVLPKPYQMNELQACICAITRRAPRAAWPRKV